MREKEKAPKVETKLETAAKDVLLEIRELKKTEPEYFLGETTLGQPKEIRAEVAKTLERLKAYGVSDEDLKKEAVIRAQELTDLYLDKRFDILKGTYLRLEVIRALDELVAAGAKPEAINGLGMINFDLNGLKAVNDLSGHDAGDKFLERVAQVFKSGQTTKELEKSGIQVKVFAGGGDEFTIFVNGQKNLAAAEKQQTTLDLIREKYEAEIAALDCSDLIDFKKPDVKNKLAELEIPKGFAFQATASGGAATLREILDNYYIEGGADYYSKLGVIMGGLIDLSDNRANANKRQFKKDLAKSPDPNEKFLSLILKRNIEAMELEEENRGLRQRIQELEKKS